MYLRSIRLRGFKSFAKQTELLLEPGVAVVIGPNGSGKSNLAEAVMWALGEQSPTSVRGASMQDVIFAGSDGRRASGGAEVELVFDNGDGALPIPAAEVSVLRRVRRDGQSEYRINQASCRLTDVVELMSAVGLGKELHSIIGQGRVEWFLSSKPADRRAMVEEAAGLGRYKRRRERAVLKLRETQRNLERAVDLEREVGAQLAPLRRQASAAEQLRAAERDVAETRGRLLSGELEALDGRLDATRATLEAAEAEGAQLEADLAAIADGRAQQEEAFARALRERERRTLRALRARALAGRLEGCSRLTEQRVRLFEEVVRAGEAERDRLLTELATAAAENDDWPSERAALEEALRTADAEHAHTAAALAAARRVLGELRGREAKAEGEREEATVRLARLRERHAGLTAELAELEQGCGALEREARSLEEAAATALAERARAEEAEEAAVAALERSLDAERAAGREAAAAEMLRVERAAEAAALDAEVRQRAAAVAAMQEVDDDVVAVLGAFPGALGLAHGLQCDEGYERALGAALAFRGAAVTVPASVDRWALLGALRAAGVGIARLLLGARRVGPVRGGDLVGSEPLLEHVHGAGDAVRQLIEDVVVVDDLRAVPDAFAGLAVTRAGEYYRPASGELGLAAGVPATALLERRAEVEGLRRRRSVLERGLREAVALAEAARMAADEATRRRAAREREADGAHAAAARLRREADGLGGRLRDAMAAAARDSQRRSAHSAELVDLDEAIARIEEDLADLLASAEAAAAPLAEAEAAVLAAEEDHERALAALTRRRVELEQRAAAAERAARERAARERRAEVGRERLRVLQGRLAAVPTAAAAARAFGEALSAFHAVATTVVERLESAQTALAEAPDREGLRKLALREADVRRAADEARERQLSARVEAARLEERRRELAAACEEIARSLEIAHFAPPADDDEAAALARAVERAERRIERIGPVNPLAESECAELGERAAFLREQRRDMERSLEDLETLIADMTGRVDAGFSEMFALVEGHFAHMIGTLFPGGRGRLTLVGEDGGDDAGVAVEVKPGRKLGKRLAMLSGGERSLAAIAFLMSLMLARPSPFYILDEIEAALDDVNIGRLVDLVREYRTRTQFIIITHQKRTMEAADILYGVTMGDDAASRVVSARMAEEEIERRAEAG